MNPSKLLRDPMGNIVRIPVRLFNCNDEKYGRISKVVTAPSYVINEKNSRLYFFRLIGINRNLLIEAGLTNNEFKVKAFIVNPSPKYVSGLLMKGVLICF